MSKQRPLVSIVITNYNYGQYLREAIESALSQTYQNIEIILIDDASTDDSRKIYNKYHDKIRIIEHKKNKGIVFSRNEALNIIKGDFLCFLDADDILPNDYIEKLMTEMVDERQDVVYTDLQTFGDGNDLMVLPDFSLDKIIGRNIVDMSALIRVEAIGDQRFDKNLDKLSHEDWDFFLGLALKGKKFARNHETILNYRIHDNNQSRNKLIDQHENALRMVKMNDYVINKYKRLYPAMVAFTKDNELVGWRITIDRQERDLSIMQKDAVDREEAIKSLQYEIKKLSQLISRKSDIIASKERIISNIINSRSYKLGQFIFHPIRKIIKK